MSTPPIIRAVHTHPVIAPLAEPVTTSSGAITEAPLVLVDLLTDAGPTGHAYVFAYQRFALKSLNELVLALGELVTGRALVPLELERHLRRQFVLLGGAKSLAGIALSGIDMAVWDALAKTAGMPLATLLGGAARTVPAYRSVGMVRVETAESESTRTCEAGFGAVKIKLGWPTLAEDLEVVRAMRRHLPAHVGIMVDFNQSLGVTEAIRRGRALDREGITWIEEPVRCDDFEGCARVAAQIETPVQIGENLTSHFEMARALCAEASDLLMPDIQQIGGVTGWMRAAGLAQAWDREISSHLFVEISAHVLSVTPTARWLEFLDIAGAVLREPMRVTDGCVQPPEGAGVGLAWDPDAVRRYRA